MTDSNGSLTCVTIEFILGIHQRECDILLVDYCVLINGHYLILKISFLKVYKRRRAKGMKNIYRLPILALGIAMFATLVVACSAENEIVEVVKEVPV